MGQKEWRPSTVLDVFADPVARNTLVLANGQAVSANQLAETLDVSPPTIYRRIDPLVEANLLKERQQVDPDGNQHKEYETVLEEVTVAIENDGYAVDIQVDRDLTDDFEALWSDIESTSHRLDIPQDANLGRDDGRESDPT